MKYVDIWMQHLDSDLDSFKSIWINLYLLCHCHVHTYIHTYIHFIVFWGKSIIMCGTRKLSSRQLVTLICCLLSCFVKFFSRNIWWVHSRCWFSKKTWDFSLKDQTDENRDLVQHKHFLHSTPHSKAYWSWNVAHGILLRGGEMSTTVTLWIQVLAPCFGVLEEKTSFHVYLKKVRLSLWILPCKKFTRGSILDCQSPLCFPQHWNEVQHLPTLALWLGLTPFSMNQQWLL